jgi:hypothetical protein
MQTDPDNPVPSATALSDDTYVPIACELPCPVYACAHIIAELESVEMERDALRERERRLRELLTTLRHCGANDCGECADVRTEMAELLAAKEGL